jgi:flagella basal body P-ring formation protein FlgA
MSVLALALVAHVETTCPAARATVLDLGIARDSVADATWSVQGNACRERPLLRVTASRDGRSTTLTLRPRLRIERPGARLAAAATAGSTVSIEEGWVPYTTPKLDANETWTARRDLPAGHILTPYDVALPVDASKGSVVQVVVQRGALRLSTEGRLLADARLNQPTRALNPRTGTVMNGVLVNATTLEIR